MVAKLCTGRFCRRPAAFWGRHLQEAAAPTERQTWQNGGVLFSTEAHHTSSTSPTELLSACSFGKDMVWHTSLASCWTLDETVASCKEKSFRTFSFHPGCNNPAVTAPDHIVPLLISCAVPLRWRTLSVAKSASRPPAAFSSCRRLCRHLLGFQLWLSLVS